MATGILVAALVICFVVFFVFYKRQAIAKMFSLNVSALAGEFQQQMEQTADVVLKQMEEQMGQLELLIEEAEKKSAALDEKLKAAEDMLNRDVSGSIPTDKTGFFSERSAATISADDSTVFPEENSALDLTTTNRRSVVLMMAEQGYGITDIAKATAMGKGEVMLLLQLNKK